MARLSAARADAIFAFDVRNELLKEKIAVAELIAGRVDIETALAFRRHHQKVCDLVLAPQVLDHAPSPGAEQCLLVLSQAVKEVKHRIAPWRGTLGVIVWRQLHAVVDRLFEDAAVDDAAVGAALRIRRQRKQDGQREQGPAKSKHGFQFTRNAAPARDRDGPRAQPGKGPKPG